jgi:UDP-N-acetylglucosamine--N-acetylmuramyl-(pentapeptide) pyrophosphoryl-undecaprenol N-acetylglucosamine transferase
MRIVLTGGGTGGHVAPFGPIIEALRLQYAQTKQTLPAELDPKQLEIIFVGVATPEAIEFFRHYDVPVVTIPSGKLRRYVSFKTVVDLGFRLPLGLLLALVRIWRLMPDVVISKGGFGSIPTVLAAAWYRIPILLHESDAIPGLASRISARVATVIAVAHEALAADFKKYTDRVFATGVPVRTDLTLVDRAEARRLFGVTTDEPLVLVMGGSQGAAQVNETLLKILPSLVTDMTIVHLTGPDHFTQISTVAAELLAASPRQAAYRPYAYLTERLAHALVAADLVIARAGASTLAELAHLRKPALLIPLASAAGDHQRKNAELFERLGAARVLEPNNVTPALLEHNIRQLITNPEMRRTLSEAMAKLDRPNAAKDIAALANELVRGKRPATNA